MKVFLLAAGYGTRLKPLTDKIPKCLVPINGKPLLEYWLDLFEIHKINEVFINLHYLPDKVKEYISNYKGKLRITTVYEENLLGSAGTLRENRQWLGGDQNFLVAYADNLTNANLTAMIDQHRKLAPVLTVALAESNRPQECGIAVVDDDLVIQKFIEKPENPPTNLANCGIYVADIKLFDYMGKKTPLDFGFDVMPLLNGKMRGYILKDYLEDIGNISRYEKAQDDVLNGKFKLI